MANNMMRYEPGRLVPLSEAMNQLFNESFAFPRLLGRDFGPVAGSNLYETKEAFILQVALPGAKAEDVEITVQNAVLNLHAKSQVTAPEGARALWSGLSSTEFSQSFTLPAPVNSESAQADFTDGILTLTLPKVEHAKARTIKVNATGASANA